jgi:hypothetical protein
MYCDDDLAIFISLMSGIYLTHSQVIHFQVINFHFLIKSTRSVGVNVFGFIISKVVFSILDNQFSIIGFFIAIFHICFVDASIIFSHHFFSTCVPFQIGINDAILKVASIFAAVSGLFFLNSSYISTHHLRAFNHSCHTEVDNNAFHAVSAPSFTKSGVIVFIPVNNASQIISHIHQAICHQVCIAVHNH